MFGDISGMMQKLKDAQQKVEETKIRLNTVIVEGRQITLMLKFLLLPIEKSNQF